MTDDREAALWAADRERAYDVQARAERIERARQDDLDIFEWHLSVLAENLRWAAALCASHFNALDEAEEHRLYHEYGYRTKDCWFPGCGRPAP